MNQLEERLADLFSGGELIRMIFSSKRKKSVEYNKVSIRPVEISGQVLFQAEYTFDKKVTHENLSCQAASALALQLIKEDFKQINAFTLAEDIQILASKPEKARITTKPATKGMPSLEHNKTKNYIIADGVPCDFLIRLGVMEESGKVIQKHYSKFRQINRYLEIVEDVFPYLPTGRVLKIIDFGCGKAYLTFALYYYLRIRKNRDVQIIGLDLKKDVIRFCRKIAEDLHYDGLKFLMGDIADYRSDQADMVVTLHACDTATDYALINAVSWNTKVILSVPCCQHELFSQIENDLHQPMLKYGILKDRLTEYLTDGLRGLKLEAAGYEVAMIEFTSLEHTARNIMIKAIKTGSPGSARAAKAQAEYEALRDFYQVEPTIERL
ncbi:class I SAM-dependent methyltransferase [Emergencia timonensis]|uniref:class I SAM-dependent methyltransferase n=1 Tax=Emergencia timonensis TaxID=1776384 RepID=UPI00399658C9